MHDATVDQIWWKTTESVDLVFEAPQGLCFCQKHTWTAGELITRSEKVVGVIFICSCVAQPPRHFTPHQEETISRKPMLSAAAMKAHSRWSKCNLHVVKTIDYLRLRCVAVRTVQLVWLTCLWWCLNYFYLNIISHVFIWFSHLSYPLHCFVFPVTFESWKWKLKTVHVFNKWNLLSCKWLPGREPACKGGFKRSVNSSKRFVKSQVSV